MDVNRLCSNLSDKIKKAKQSEKIRASIIFSGYFEGLPIFMSVAFSPSGNTSLFKPANYSRFFIHGSARVAAEMYDSNAVPKQSLLSQYAKYLGDDATLDDAEHFAKGYIDACCSPLGHELATGECEIGGWVHVAEVTPPGRFRWRIAPK
jgi:hypothetical protein